MSRFFVGQRVRLIAAESFPQLMGTEARITKIDCVSFSVTRQVMEGGMIQLDIPSPISEINAVCAKPEWLQPILPEGAAPSELTFRQLMCSLQEATA